MEHKKIRDGPMAHARAVGRWPGPWTATTTHTLPELSTRHLRLSFCRESSPMNRVLSVSVRNVPVVAGNGYPLCQHLSLHPTYISGMKAIDIAARHKAVTARTKGK